jgi:raffinose/stachyose/melibiose transport system substrate-binding protein
MKRRILVGWFIMVGIILVIGSLGLTQERKTVILWDQFFPAAQSRFMDKVIEEFEQQNPEINIERSVMDTESIRKVLKVALSADAGPDIFYYDSGPGFLGVLVQAGLVRDLSQDYEQRGWNQKFFQWTKERCSYGGKVYGVGNEIEYTCVFYNRAILKDLGLENLVIPYPQEEKILTLGKYGDYLSMCEKAKQAGYIPIAFANRDPGRGGHLQSYFYELVAGKEKVEEVMFGDGRWDSPEFILAWQKFKELQDKGYFPPDVNAIDYDEGNMLFYIGKSLTHITGTWLIADIMETMEDPSVADFFLLPPITEGLPLRAAAGIGSAFAVSQSTPYPDVAADFIDHLFSPSNAERWITEAYIIPPVEVELDKIMEKVPIMMQRAIVGAALPQGHGYNLDVVMPENVNYVTKSGIQALLAGEKTPEVLAQEIEAAWEEAKQAGLIFKR